MSRIGKKIIEIPAGVSVKVEGQLITVTGPKGTQTVTVLPSIAVVVDNSKLEVKIADHKDKRVSAFWGLTRSLIANMVIGVTDGFNKSLEINGVGFKATVQGQILILNVGFSHPVEYQVPEGISVTVDKNIISVTGIDKQKVGQVAAEIRAIKKPEPYKGKGIKYADEVIRRKVGKVVKSAS